MRNYHKEREEDFSRFMRGFGQLANAFDGGGDRGAVFPQSDADDFGRGARFIPGEVTLARRGGQPVTFVQPCGPCCWYWQFPNGDRVYHWVRYVYERIGQANGRQPDMGDGETFDLGKGWVVLPPDADPLPTLDLVWIDGEGWQVGRVADVPAPPADKEPPDA